MAEYPFASHTFEVAGGWRMHYVDEGPRDGPVVLLVHGNPTWSYYYRHLIAALRDRFRVIAPDHIGMGLSDKPAAGAYPFTLARRVEDLAALIDGVVGSRPVSLVVHDWGGMIGTAWATAHADRVRRMVVLNTAAFRMPATKKMPWQLRLVRTPIVGPLLVRGGNAFCRAAVRQCVVRPLPREVRRAYLAPYHNWHSRLAVLRFVQDIPLDAAHASYQQVEATEHQLERLSHVPMLIGWGMRDFVFDRPFLEQWRHHFPQAAVYCFPDAGHYVLEDARDALVPEIDRFLSDDLNDPANRREA